MVNLCDNSKYYLPNFHLSSFPTALSWGLKSVWRQLVSDFVTTAILRLSCDWGLEPGRQSSVFDMPIPMFDLRASAALARQTHKEKIFFLCSLDRHHTAPGQQGEPDPLLHCTENQSFTRQRTEQQHAEASAAGLVLVRVRRPGFISYLGNSMSV